jgi:hypothetical protein
MAERVEREYLTIVGSTPAKPYGCELIAKKYADIGSARRKDVSSLIGMSIMFPIFKDDCMMKKLRFISIKLNN